jgi:hypothetical protein
MDVKDVQERWLDAKDDYDKKESREWAEQAKIRDEAEAAADAEMGDDVDLENMPIPAGGSGIKVVRKNQ